MFLAAPDLLFCEVREQSVPGSAPDIRRHLFRSINQEPRLDQIGHTRAVDLASMTASQNPSCRRTGCGHSRHVPDRHLGMWPRSSALEFSTCPVERHDKAPELKPREYRKQNIAFSILQKAAITALSAADIICPRPGIRRFGTAMKRQALPPQARRLDMDRNRGPQRPLAGSRHGPDDTWCKLFRVHAMTQSAGRHRNIASKRGPDRYPPGMHAKPVFPTNRKEGRDMKYLLRFKRRLPP